MQKFQHLTIFHNDLRFEDQNTVDALKFWFKWIPKGKENEKKKKKIKEVYLGEYKLKRLNRGKRTNRRLELAVDLNIEPS